MLILSSYRYRNDYSIIIINDHQKVLDFRAPRYQAKCRSSITQNAALHERQFIAAARTTGASDVDIIYREIAPNVMPLALIGVTFALAWAIITEASIGFLGFSDPNVVSWGSIIYEAYASQMMYRAPWWVLPPGIAIMILVTSVYFIGRAYEEVINPRLKEGG